MEDKIEVGEYVRTKKGRIDKVERFSVGLCIWHCENGMCIDECNRVGTHLEDIVKHSKQLIDLSEVGDLIIYRLRGLKHQGKGFIRIYKDARSGKENLEIDSYSLEQIEIIEILTHEQIEQNCYKVGGENG